MSTTSDDVLTERDARTFSESLAKSLGIFATIPRPIAEAHMRLRGYDAPPSSVSDAEVRGALLKALSDEVLLEREAKLRGEAFDPYVNARGRPQARRTQETAERRRCDRSNSRETKGKALGARSDSDDEDSESGSSVGGAYKPRDVASASEEETSEEEYGDASGPSDDDYNYCDDEEAEADDDGNYFGRAEMEPPAPDGANPFASIDFDLGEEARVQIEEAKRVCAARDARANDLSDAFTSLRATTGSEVSPAVSGRVAFSDKDDVASIAGSIAASDVTDRFDAVSLASVAATLGSDATDRVADVDSFYDDLRSLAGRAEVIYESGSGSDGGFPGTDSDEDHATQKENAPPTP